MNHRPIVAAIKVIALMDLVTAASAIAAGPLTEVTASGDVKLVADSNGEQIADFSRCGYGGGGVAIPKVAVAATVAPAGDGDDTARIQQAIDEVSKLAPDAVGLRGAVMLGKGTYRVAGSLAINTGGVVLRGSGQGEDGTVIRATGKKKRTVISISGGSPLLREPGSGREIAAERVAAGSCTIPLENTTGLAVGDRVVVVRRCNQEWINTIGMDRMARGGIPWKPQEYEISYERRILAIRDKAIEVDSPLVMAIEKRFGGGFVSKITSGRIAQVGVENLRLVSEYEKGAETSDENHAWAGVGVGNAEDVWVCNVTGQHFGYGTLSLSGRALRVTVADCANLDPVSPIQGGRRYSFTVNGQQCLVTRCYSRGGRHDFVLGPRTAGPNAFVDCLAEGPLARVSRTTGTRPACCLTTWW